RVEDREAGLWAVLEWHKSDEDAVVRAAVELLRMYLKQPAAPRASLLAETLIQRDDKDPQAVGHLAAGLFAGRAGDSEKSNGHFISMVGLRETVSVPSSEALEELARAYFLTLSANAARLELKDRDPALVEGFLRTFTRRGLR
ncbi:MAG: hypothetical protein ACRC1K_05165, partial [Planctomycetia bacterium]